uniref:Uncharacterized protein n=1 Tax=Strix occidentalis caurina TaxID=311401 RepID=A0A8D0FQR1_STROC
MRSNLVCLKVGCTSVPICLQGTLSGPVLSLFCISVASQPFSTFSGLCSTDKEGQHLKIPSLSLMHSPWMYDETVKVLSVPLSHSSVPALCLFPFCSALCFLFLVSPLTLYQSFWLLVLLPLAQTSGPNFALGYLWPLPKFVPNCPQLGWDSSLGLQGISLALWNQ